MKSMTVQERLKDISEICGMSEDIVRRVLMAEQTSIIKSLKRGERSTLPGRCIIIPELRNDLKLGGKLGKSIKLTAKVAGSLASELDGLESFERTGDDEELPEGVILRQITSLI